MLASVLGQQIEYFKRFRMEVSLDSAPLPRALPSGFRWIGWQGGLEMMHAEVKYHSFHEEIDSTVFPNLGDADGCRRLMSEITQRKGFCPEATWLIACDDGNCGTVQGVCARSGIGMIQNLGIMPLYRGMGLGSALLLKALDGFRRAGLSHAILEVTAQNEGALRMYRRIGFRCKKTLYKAVEIFPEMAFCQSIM